MTQKNMTTVKESRAGVPGAFEYLGRALEDLFDLPIEGGAILNAPRMNMRETDKTIEVSVVLPGMHKKDIKLDLTQHTLAVSCERRETTDEKDAGYRLQEEIYGRFYRSFNLPAAVKTGDAKAAYKDGVLTVTLQKQHMEKAHQLAVR